MNGDGKVSTTGVANGKVDQSAWAGKGKDGKELFGNATDLGDGRQHANGFEALRAAAHQKLGAGSVQDGVLDAQEIALLERPVAQGGIGLTIEVDGKQVRPSESGVTQINLGYTEAGANPDENGNQHRQVGAGFVRNGDRARMNDVWFQHG